MRRIAPTAGPAPHVRPAAEEHRQQDHVYMAVQLGAGSEALQPCHLHAEPAPDRSAGGGRGHVPDDAARDPLGMRRKATPTPQQADEVLLDYLRNLYPLAEAQAQMAKLDATAKQLGSGQARHQPIRLLQLPRNQGLRERAAHRYRAV